MQTLRYYRCDDPGILAVFDELVRQQDQLIQNGNLLADQVTAHTGHQCSAVYCKDVTHITIAGVKFEHFSPELEDSFIKPSRSRNNITRPKKKADPALKALFSNLPSVERIPGWKAIGIEWDSLLFTPLSYVHSLGQSLYVSTSLDLTEKLVEITGGEYQQAEQQAEQQAQENS